MQRIELSAGTIEVEITGEGPPVVLLHGLLMNHHQWDTTLPYLPAQFRYIRPVLPLGSHRIPMHPDADLSLKGIVKLVAELLAAMDLHDVTLVHTDWGGALLLTALGLDERVGSLVILPCEAFSNFPPGLPGKMALLAARMPGGITLAARQLRIPWLRRTRLLFGQMAKYPVDQSLMESWTEPCLESGEVRRDLRAYATSEFNAAELIPGTEALSRFRGDALVLWSPENRVMPPEHGPRLADLIPRARLENVPDAYVVSMLDQPEKVGRAISQFLTRKEAGADSSAMDQ